MIRLVSCGIEHASAKEPIPCARTDAERIYSSFQSHFPDFDNAYSITLYNASAESFQRAIRNALKGLDETDTLAIYFSGHAFSDGTDELKLLFREGREDTLSQRVLWDITDHSACNKLLILDCCHAGEASSLSNYTKPGSRKFFTLMAVGPNGMAEHSQSVSPFTRVLIDCLDELDATDQAITLTSIHRALKKTNYLKSALGIAVGETDLSLKAANCTAGNAEFLTAFWNKLPTLPSSMRAIMWYALDSSNLGYDTKIKSVEQLWNSRPRFYEGSWIVRRAIGHLLGELPQRAPRVKSIEKKLLASHSWMDVCIGLVATRNQNTDEMQKKRREICENPEFPMDVIWLANLYYADHFTAEREGAPGDEIFFPRQLCETDWGVEDLFTRYKDHEDVLKRLEQAVSPDFQDVLQAPKMMLDPKNFCSSNPLLNIYLQCPKRGRTTASYHDKWLRSVLFGQWRDHPIADDALEVYFTSKRLKTCQNDLKALRSATVDIKLGILSYISSLPSNKSKTYQEALSWALEDPHPWVRRDAFGIFHDRLDLIQQSAFSDCVDRDHYPGVLDMIIEANAVSKQPEWNTFLREYSQRYEFIEAEKKAIDSYLK